MVLFTEKLYKNIIQAEASSFDKLRVISGYGSPSFLRRIKKEFPDLTITLFLGMTKQGISEQNHAQFKLFTEKFEDMSIYYDISAIPNHMKIVEFVSSESRKTFIGSANFTENGFINQRESMTLIDDCTDLLFQKQKELSLLCTDENIEKYVPFYFDTSLTDEYPDLSVEVIEINEVNDESEKGKQRYDANEKYFKTLKLLRSNANKAYYNTFDIEIVLKSDHNPRWDATGINAWSDDKVPTLVQTPRLSFDQVFPVEESFEIISDDGEKYQAQLTGRFNGNLVLNDGNIYEYVRKHIGLAEKRPINHKDLEDFGNTKIHFERLDRNSYLMYFEPKD